MKAAQESLQQEVMALGQAMYQGGESAQNSSNSTGSSDDVIDAEFSSDK
jgi:L1 cell adhesion molecule like protein